MKRQHVVAVGVGIATVKWMFVFCAGISILAGCSSKKQPAWTYTAPPHPIAIPTSVAVGRYGIGCRTVSSPDTIGPPSFSVKDIGKPGVPTLSPQQISIVRGISRYVHSQTLRFAFIGDRFIVFDATQGPCSEAAVGYRIMNDPESNNLYYQPGEAPGDIHVGPGDAAPTQGPWMKNR